MVSLGQDQEDLPPISPSGMDKDVVPCERSELSNFRESFAQHQMTLKKFVNEWFQQQDWILERTLRDLGVKACSERACTQGAFPSQFNDRRGAEPIPLICTSAPPTWSNWSPPAAPAPLSTTSSAEAASACVPIQEGLLWGSTESSQSESRRPPALDSVEPSTPGLSRDTSGRINSMKSVLPPWEDKACLDLHSLGSNPSDDEHRDNFLSFFGDRIAKRNKSPISRMSEAIRVKDKDVKRASTTDTENSSHSDYTMLRRVANVGKNVRKGLHQGLQRLETQVGDMRMTGPQRKGCLSRVVLSRHFETLACIVILTNAGFLAYTSDYARQHLDNPSTFSMDVIEVCFCVIYTLELFMRFCVYRKHFFLGEDWRWNILDVTLVVFAINDQISNILQESGSQVVQNMSFLRVMRLMRMMKLLRVIRLMRMFRELRIIMNSIMGSVKAMVWSMLLVFSIVFLFAMCFVQASTEYLQNTNSTDVSAQTQLELDKWWGTVAISMNSLYEAVTGGEDWNKVARPLLEVGMAFYIIFILYIGFMVAVVANTLTSMFVESAILNGDKDLEQSIHRELENINEHVATLQKWFEKIDVDKDGEITFNEFRNHCNAPEMIAFAKSLDLDTLDVRRFFSIISCNGSRAVDLETFVVGCVKLQGMARNMDLMDLIYNHRLFVKDASHRMELICMDVAEIKERLPPLPIQTSLRRSRAANELGEQEFKAMI